MVHNRVKRNIGLLIWRIRKRKKFKSGARMIDNKVLVYEDVPLDDHAHPSKYIIRVVDWYYGGICC